MDSAGLPANLVREGIGVLVAVGGPVLGALLVVGLVVGVLQAATQINDPAVGFVPRLVAGIAVVAFMGNWILERLAKYFSFALQRISEGM
jgi:flagellar biosynthesis protein FliQ